MTTCTLCCKECCAVSLLSIGLQEGGIVFLGHGCGVRLAECKLTFPEGACFRCELAGLDMFDVILWKITHHNTCMVIHKRKAIIAEVIIEVKVKVVETGLLTMIREVIHMYGSDV